ncbi:entericidin B membrane lipoprotein [mine drainage metagenome]|uniref:Entericidin B membrane lipoprotein n=1 Tax=mine drainage metagenome TaxID=410659 RepID=A0A1J5S8Z9_9ZZZZ
MKALVIFIGMSVSLAACNTVHGFGKDLEKGGEAIQKAVK